jgi:uncharacterized cupredoxin-like copper-binding protein
MAENDTENQVEPEAEPTETPEPQAASEPEAPVAPGDDAPAEEEQPAEDEEAAEVDVSLTEFAIDMPTELPAGPTTFVVTNDGTIEHSLEIEGQGIEEELEPHLQPGESGTLEVDLAPGTYEVYCPVGNHREQGMELELTVAEG